jgi:hypothetical protein
MQAGKKLKHSRQVSSVLKCITDKKNIMNWGYKILFVYALFVLGIMLLVFKSSSQKMDLVTNDYYEKELVFQQRIDEGKRVDSLSSPVSCEIINSDLFITFPKDFNGKKITGMAVLYCPSDESKDISHDFSTADNALVMPVGRADNYELHLSWEADGIRYYLEKKLKRT